MTDIRCPMCGKTNPGDREVCLYCQARLKPLVADDQPEKTPSPGKTEPDEDIPEWLRSLRPDASFESSPEQEAEELPDWLSPPTKSISEEESAPASSPEDWMTSLREENIQGEEETPAEPQGGWEGTPQEPAKEEDIPEWLTGMRSDSGEFFNEEEPSASAFSQGETQEGEPEWLKQVGPPDEEPLPESARQEGEADFLASLRGQGEEQVEAGGQAGETQPPLEEPGELPDWLSEVEGRPEQPSQPEEMPDWLAGQTQAPEEAPIQAEDVPSWLAEFEEKFRVEEPPTSAGELGMQSFEAGEVAEEKPEMPPPTELPEEATPDWLVGTTSGKIVEASEVEAEEETPALDVPDWLEGYAAASALENVFSPETSEQAPDTTLDWLETQEETTELEEESQAEASLANAPEVIAPFSLEEEGLPVDQGEIPEWLGELPGEEILPETIIPPDEAGTDLAEAELPTWLTPMRPVEMAAPEAPLLEESDKPMEGSGPLAGLRSVLPGEYEVGKVKPPPTYSVKLQVSETQQAHASLVESLVKSEGEPGKISTRKISGHQILIVAGIFVLMVIVVLWPVLTGSQDVALPAYPPEAVDAGSLISSLPPNSPVLLAVDYEPALSGEMEATANGVIDQLMLKGAYLTMVSTSPNGPAQAERLIRSVDASSEHTYQDASQYAILGYIPGGAAGLRSFAESPKRIMPYALNASGDQSVWDVPPLSKVNSLADFGLVAVITENPYTARTWIEQVQPLLGKAPMIMVISAQAEPVVRPYYEGLPRQVQGFVAGLTGAAAYENMTQRLSTARKYWDAYSLGISVIAAILIIGGVVNLVLALISKQKPRTGEA